MEKGILLDKNSKLILQQIFNNENITRVQIAKNLDMNKATVTNILNDLKNEHFVKETGAGDSTKIGGRKPILLAINENYGYTISIDIGYDYLEVMYNFFNGQIMRCDTFLLKEKTMPEVINTIKEKVNFNSKLGTTNGLLGISLSIHGIVDNERDIVDSPFLDLKNVSIIDEFEKITGVPINIENEANLSAIFERDFNEKNINNLIAISIHKGIGAGLIINGKLYRGLNGEAGELGRTLFHFKDGSIYKLQKIEEVCSQDAIINRLQKKLNKELDLKEIGKMYEENCVVVTDEIDLFIQMIALLIHNVNVQFNPDTIYLNSPLINEIPETMIRIRRELESISSQKISIKLSSNVKHSILLGASSYITHRILGMDHLKLKF
ncbi:ROK family protein [Salinicoccus sp. HZC-1]|uniref:ROK family protein n=1 Tax=Salinicoccus sp. HZC-1 TaxID=3385497 RepID=UPI00398ACFAE